MPPAADEETRTRPRRLPPIITDGDSPSPGDSPSRTPSRPLTAARRVKSEGDLVAELMQQMQQERAGRYNSPGQIDADGFDPYSGHVGPGVYGGKPLRDDEGEVIIGPQYQNHCPAPGPVYAGGGYTQLNAAILRGPDGLHSYLLACFPSRKRLIKSVSTIMTMNKLAGLSSRSNSPSSSPAASPLASPLPSPLSSPKSGSKMRLPKTKPPPRDGSVAALFGEKGPTMSQQEKLRRISNEMSAGGASPLHMCGMTKHGELCTRALIEHGAEIEPVDSFGFTPLHRMCSSNNAIGAEALLRAGADPNLRTAPPFAGRSPLQIARDSNARDVANVLRRFGAVESPRPSTGTPKKRVIHELRVQSPSNAGRTLTF